MNAFVARTAPFVSDDAKNYRHNDSGLQNSFIALQKKENDKYFLLPFPERAKYNIQLLLQAILINVKFGATLARIFLNCK
jgi:hypothetical protein